MDATAAIRRTRARVAFKLVAGLFAAAASAHAAHPRALWRVVHDLCVVDRKLTGLAAPCIEVNLKGGYAMVPDPALSTHLLLVPLRRTRGIEDPQVLKPAVPNYWRQAWAASPYLARRVGRNLPRDAVGLAVNAVAGRSPDQLHVHLSCTLPFVTSQLKALQPTLSERWSLVTVFGQQWRVRTLAGANLSADPFKLLAQSSPEVAAHMGQQTLVVIGAQLQDGAPGFYLLSRSADQAAGYQGHGEFLLDETCRAVGRELSGAGRP